MSKDLDIFSGLLDGDPPKQRSMVGSEEPAIDFTPDFGEYARIVIFTSGGKDSTACVLHLLALGVPRSKIELHHHEIDGREGSHLMDWPCTHGYVEAFGRALDLPVLFSWKQGGFETELLRQNCKTTPIVFTRGDGQIVTMGGERSKISTRRKFPQVTANLSQRWCSSSLKIDVGHRLLVNDPRFTEGKTLVVTGERAEESANRARYAKFEPHRADNRNGRVPRWIDHWRPVHSWPESAVWTIMQRERITPHPAYYLGFGRASCMNCIFGSANQWATIRAIAPQQFQTIANYEQDFGLTIHRTRSVVEQADRGINQAKSPYWTEVALSPMFTIPMFMDPWELPIGAYGDNSGPT